MPNYTSQLEITKSSLREMLLTAKYCIEYEKDPSEWGHMGCLGFPSLLILLSIADSIGSYVIGGSIVRKRFNILKNPDCYGLCLTKKEIDRIYYDYRNYITHNSAINLNHTLGIGEYEGDVLEVLTEGVYQGLPCLNLKPLYRVTKKAVNFFVSNFEG